MSVDSKRNECMMFGRRLCAGLFLISAPMLSMAAAIDIGAESEYDLAAADNVVGNTLNIGGNATLKLNGSVTDGMFALNPAIIFSGAGTLTVDVSELTGCTAIRMVNHVRDASANGQGTIAFPAGIAQVVFGSVSRSGPGGLNNSSTPRAFPAFEADVSFVEAGGLFVFTNDVSLVRLPATGGYTIREGSRIALFGKELLGSGNYTLTNFDIQICNINSFSEGATVTVPDGRTLYVRPGKLKNATSSDWDGQSVLVTNNVVLGGSNASLRFQNNNVPGLVGDVTGEGRMIYGGNGSVQYFGNLSFTGALVFGEASSANGHELRTPNGATIVPKIQFSNGGHTIKCKLRPDGWSEGPTSVTIPVIESTATGTPILDIGREVTVNVGEISGLVEMSSSDPERSATLVVDNLKSNAKLYVRSGLRLAVNSYEAGAQIFLVTNDLGGAGWTISGPSSGSAVTPPLNFPEDVSPLSLSLGGKLRLPDVLPVDEVAILPGADVEANLAAGTRVINNGGTFKPIVRTWRDKVTLWTDATDTSTFTYARDSYVNDMGGTVDDTKYNYIKENQIVEWRDCRADHQVAGALRFRMVAFDKNNPSITSSNYGAFPYLEMVDDKQAVRLYPSRGRAAVATGFGKNATLAVKYALLVFNGKHGGGQALFSTTGSQMKRVEDASSQTATVDSPLIYANNVNFAFRTNGVDVAEPTQTPLTGGWQLIGFTCDGVTVNNIGQYMSYNDASGNGRQVYGEILLFNEIPPEADRMAAESYLAKKWNLPYGGEPVDDDSDSVDLTLLGSGTMELSRSVSVTNGLFSGTVDLNGNRMQLSTNALPFTEATVPAADRALWIDPSLSGAVVFGDNMNKPTEVAYIYSRDNAGLLTADGNPYVVSPIAANGGTDRRVRVVNGARANGTAATWLEFTDGYGNDNAGNHLLVAEKLPAQIPAAYTESKVFADIAAKSAFFVLDTTKGGGTVVATAANGTTGSFRTRGSSTQPKPIWPSGNAEDVKNAPTYLDGVQVNGATDTFSLRPEVLSFSLPENSGATMKVFGYSGTTATEKPTNDEIMGEWILYTKVQSEETRKAIEAYLMLKWLGKLRDGFSDFRGMTVTGAGTLAAVGPEYLPTLSAEFTGTIEFSRTVWTFTLPTDGGAAATDAVDLAGRTVALPAAVTIDLNMAGAKPGTYRLMSAGSISDGTVFTLGTVTGQGNKRIALLVSETAVDVSVGATGTVFMMR